MLEAVSIVFRVDDRFNQRTKKVSKRVPKRVPTTLITTTAVSGPKLSLFIGIIVLTLALDKTGTALLVRTAGVGFDTGADVERGVALTDLSSFFRHKKQSGASVRVERSRAEIHSDGSSQASGDTAHQ